MPENKSKLRFSAGAKALMPRLVEINLDHFEEWFLKQSTQTIVGSGTFTEYFQFLDSLKKENGN